MIRFASLIVLVILSAAGYSQKLNFKLEFNGEEFSGKMNPSWFEQVILMSDLGSIDEFIGKEGIMTGGEFGEMRFTIDENKTGSAESLMMRTNNGWYPLEKFNLKDSKLKMKIDWAFRPAPRKEDLEILMTADKLLVDADHWNPNDDRKCEDDFKEERWSLYCVMRQASVNVSGDFNHRSHALNEIRNAIQELNPEREYEHRLMNFNNEESFERVKELLTLSLSNLRKSLSMNSN